MATVADDLAALLSALDAGEDAAALAALADALEDTGDGLAAGVRLLAAAGWWPKNVDDGWGWVATDGGEYVAPGSVIPRPLWEMLSVAPGAGATRSAALLGLAEALVTCPVCRNRHDEPDCCGCCLEQTEAACRYCPCGNPATGRASTGQVYGLPAGERARYRLCCEECQAEDAA